MHLYKNFFRILKNNKTGVVIYAVIMAAMITGLVTTVGNIGGIGEIEYNRSFNISYEDLDHSAFSEGLIATLSENNEVTDLGGEKLGRIQDLIFFTVYDIHFIIDNGEVSYITAFNGNGNTYLLTNLVDRYKSTYDAYVTMGMTEAEAAAKATDLLTDDSEITVAAEKGVSYGPSDMTVMYLNQYYGYIVMGFMSLGIGYTVIANSNDLINDRVDASPVSRKKISLINTLGLATCGLFLWVFIIAVNLIAGRDSVVIRDHLPIVLVNTFLVTLIACSFASLVTSFNMTSNTLSMVTNIVTMGMSFLCGVFVPQWLLPEGVLKVARFMPLYWNVVANNMTNSALSRVEYDGQRLLLSFGIQILFAAALAVIAALVKAGKIEKAAG